MPLSLGEALARLEADEVIKSALPVWYKRDEWERFLATVTDWDVNSYLDCLP